MWSSQLVNNETAENRLFLTFLNNFKISFIILSKFPSNSFQNCISFKFPSFRQNFLQSGSTVCDVLQLCIQLQKWSHWKWRIWSTNMAATEGQYLLPNWHDVIFSNLKPSSNPKTNLKNIDIGGIKIELYHRRYRLRTCYMAWLQMRNISPLR